MKQILLVILVLISINLSAQKEERIPGVLQTDKQLHFAAGYVISTTMAACLDGSDIKHAEWWGVAVGVAAGIYKEVVLDRKGDVKDFYATAIGAAVGGVTMRIPFIKIRKLEKEKKIITPY